MGSACSSVAATAAVCDAKDVASAHVVAALNSFGLAMLRTLAGSKGSVLLSPLCLASALSMAALGTTPGGKAQEELLGLWKVKEAEAAPFFRELGKQTVLLTAARDGVQLLSATSVWCRDSIKPSFSASAKELLAAEAHPLPKIPDPINKWVSTATNGMVPSVLDAVDPLTVALAVSAVFFKGIWSSPFEKQATMRSTFHSANKGDLPCAMMRRTDKAMAYAKEGDVQVVELPYGSDRQLVATVLLPAAGAMEKLVASLADDGTRLTTLLSKVDPTKVELQLPRFKLEFGVRDLMPELQSSFGIKEAFHGTNGFLAMSDDPEVHLSHVFHKAVVEVNEEGTKAAAAAVADIQTRSLDLTPVEEVTVDRPFIFLIRDTRSRLLLFVAAVSDPELDTSGV